jgi:hypothetical protein
MDYIDGQTVRIGKELLELRNYTLSDLSGFTDWTVHSDYGFEFEIPVMIYRRHKAAIRNFMAGINAEHICDIVIDNMKWANFESRVEKVDLLPLMYLPIVMVKWHIGDIGLFVGRSDKIVWIEELSGVGNWQSMNEMFAY